MARANFVSPPHRSTPGTVSSSPPSSPAASTSSDKENRQSASRSSTVAKGKERASARPKSTSSSQNTAMQERDQSNKRRKISNHEAQESVENNARPALVYDPDQPVEERREAAKQLRELTRELHENGRDYVKDGNSGLLRTIQRANNIMNSKVKQTTDAIIDSNLLVNAASLSLKKATALRLGDDSASIDVDEFVSKCRSFMSNERNIDAVPISANTHSDQRRSSTRRESELTEHLPWHVFGALVCLPANRRPIAPTFLLGPLSIQPRSRKLPQRQAKQRSRAPLVRPEEIRSEDIQKQKTTNNITVKCAEIKDRLQQAQAEGEAAVNEEADRLRERGAFTDAKLQACMQRYGISNNGGMNLFRFAVNPKSFGQTVENLFYISFLIREGGAAVTTDDDGLPTLHNSEASTAEEMREQNTKKFQAVFNLDYRTWQDLIDAFDIEEPMIADRTAEETREREQVRNLGGRGWYG